MQKDIIRMSRKEIKTLKVIHKVIEHRLKQKEAAEELSLSTRHLRRLIKRIKDKGDAAIAHAGRGRPSNRKYPDDFMTAIIDVVKKKYWDFGPTLAAEKLEERDGLIVSRETLRKWMINEGIWIPRKMRNEDKNHTWRKRKDCFGEMVQTDGSVGFWFENRGPKAILMAYIDDATNIAFAEFYPSENTWAAMDSFWKYILLNGLPQCLYFDRNSIYKTNRKANLDEELKGEGPKTQFEMAIEILNVAPKYAYSAQAKGRIERLFGVFKDRLVKEMRLANICSIEEANKFLKSYLPQYNRRFSVPPANEKNMHREVPKNLNLKWVFAFREERTVSKDFTLRWRNRFFLLKKQSIAIKGRRVTVLESLNDEIRIWFNGRFIEFEEITENTLQGIRNKRKKSNLADKVGPRQPWKPPKNHPWRQQNRALFQEMRR